MDRCDARGRDQLRVRRTVGSDQGLHPRRGESVEENDEVLGEFRENGVSRRAASFSLSLSLSLLEKKLVICLLCRLDWIQGSERRRRGHVDAGVLATSHCRQEGVHDVGHEQLGNRERT